MRSSGKDVQKPAKPGRGSRKVVVIKGRFQRTHGLTQGRLREMAGDCNVKWTKNFTNAVTHAVVDRAWAKSGDPRLKEGIKLMKAGWVIKVENGILAKSVEYQWTPDINEKVTSKNHGRDHGLLTPPDSLHQSPTTKRELEPPVKYFKNNAHIPLRVEQDVSISFFAFFRQILG